MPPRIRSANLPRFQCPHCSRRCYSTHGLTQHINSLHTHDERLRPDPPPIPVTGLDDSGSDEALADFMDALRDTQAAAENRDPHHDAHQRPGIVLEHPILNGKSTQSFLVSPF